MWTPGAARDVRISLKPIVKTPKDSRPPSHLPPQLQRPHSPTNSQSSPLVTPAKAQKLPTKSYFPPLDISFCYTLNMADSIQSRKAQQTTYLRQIQQEKAARKRELNQNQKEDIKSVRDYYADQNKQLEQDSAAAVNHIREESRMLAAEEQRARTEKAEAELARRQVERETRLQAQLEANAEVENLKKKVQETKEA